MWLILKKSNNGCPVKGCRNKAIVENSSILKAGEITDEYIGVTFIGPCKKHAKKIKEHDKSGEME